MNNPYLPEHMLEAPEPKKNPYLNLTEEKTYRFRQMANKENTHHFIDGWIAWEEYEKEGKIKKRPHRIPFIEGEKCPEDFKRLDKEGKPSYFWAFVVIYEGDVMILEIPQVRTRRQMILLALNPEWGDPTSYDLSITRSGFGKETTYTVQPNNKSPITPEMVQMVKDAHIDLRVLYDGGNPMGALDDRLDLEEVKEQPTNEDPNQMLSRIASNAMNK